MPEASRPRRPYWKLPEIRGFTRVPDDEHGRRMARCDRCGHVIPTLGTGYHNQTPARPCIERYGSGRRRPSP
jgi:hypothetical protein